MTILELDTGLFPDAARVTQAIETLKGSHAVVRVDVTGLAPDDQDGWTAAARAILAADRIVTL